MSLPTGSLLLTVAVNDVDATKIIYASEFSEFASLWLSKEPLNATDSGKPGIMTKPEVYK
jgi:pilus assembly protein CpaB